MSFAKRMRAKQSKAGLLTAALVAAVGLGVTQAPPPPAGASQGSSIQRDGVFVAPAKAERKKKRQVGTTGGGRRGGSIADGKHARRRWLMTLADRPNTGRQWVIVRRILRRSSIAYLLNTPAPQIAALARTRKLSFRRWQPA
jgi:hypothetical protein